MVNSCSTLSMGAVSSNPEACYLKPNNKSLFLKPEPPQKEKEIPSN